MNRKELRSGNQSLISPGWSPPPSMTAARRILVVMVAVAALLNPNREQFAWFIRLRRPAWLTFEGLIP